MQTFTKTSFVNAKNLFVSLACILCLLASCSTSINDESSSSSSRGLTIAISTDSTANSSRVANPDPYIATVSIKSDSYKDSQSKEISQGSQTSFTFEDIPVGAEVTVTCQIKLGTTIIFTDTQSATIEPEGTTVQLNLKKQLQNTFIFEDTNLANLKEIIKFYEPGTTPTVVFKNSPTCLRDTLSYLQPNTPCVLDFSNIGRTTFTNADIIDTDYDGSLGVRSFILPSNSTMTLSVSTEPEDINNSLFNGTDMYNAIYFLAKASNPTLELKYTGAGNAIFRNVDANTCSSCASNNDYNGTVKLSNNLIIEGVTEDTLRNFLPLLGSSQATIKVSPRTNYEAVMNTINLASHTDITLQLDISSQNDIFIPTISNTLSSSIPNIKSLVFTGTAPSASINAGAFKRLTGLEGKDVTIPDCVKTIEKNPTGDVRIRFTITSPFTKYDDDLDSQGMIANAITYNDYSNYNLMRD